MTIFQAIHNDTDYDIVEDQEQFANLTELRNGYENATDNDGYLEEYLENNMTCADCEDYCGLDCFSVCLLFKDSDCKIPHTTFNYSGIQFHKYQNASIKLQKNMLPNSTSDM